MVTAQEVPLPGGPRLVADHSSYRLTTLGVTDPWEEETELMKRFAVLLVVAGMMALSLPANAAPTETDSFPWFVDCDGTEITGWYEEWVQEFTLENGTIIQLGHATITYTFEGKTFSFVEAYVDLSYTNQDGEGISTRRGRLFNGRTGYYLEGGGEIVFHGLESLSADEQACAVLVG